MLAAVAPAVAAAIVLAAAFRPHEPRRGGRRPVLITARVVFGMSKAQVLRRLGPPAKKGGACWQYREGVTLHERHTIEAERLCFVSGRYSYTYPEIDGRWRLPGT